jgi:sec-independent protein translocase protein TatA
MFVLCILFIPVAVDSDLDLHRREGYAYSQRSGPAGRRGGSPVFAYAVPASLAFLDRVGAMELVVILVILLLLFGTRLPSVMRSLGKGVSEFKKGMKDIEDELTREPPSERRADTGAEKAEEDAAARSGERHEEAHRSKEEHPARSDGNGLAG